MRYPSQSLQAAKPTTTDSDNLPDSAPRGKPTHFFQAFEEFDAADCEPLEEGLRSRTAWEGGELIKGGTGPLRLRIDFDGLRAEDVKLYGVYVESCTD